MKMEVEEVALTAEQRAAHHHCYLHNLMPLDLLYRMLCRGRDWPWFYRALGLSKQGFSKQIFWRDKQRLVRDRESFERELLEFKAEQLHLGSLEYSWQQPQALLRQRWHEVVFDIDLTDYARYCACGKQKQACGQCWMHIEGTQLLLHHLLCQVLGVAERHLLWVFSGKKGIHCLCNDPRLCVLDQQGRDRLLALFSRHTVTDLIAFVQEAPPELLQQVRDLFWTRAILHRHLMQSQCFRAHSLSLVRKHWPALYTPLALAWHQPREREPEQDWLTLQQLEQEQAVPASLVLALQCYWPHIDSGPLLLDHLYKLPFSVHGDTGKLALPLERLALIGDQWPGQALGLRQLVEQYRRDGHPPALFVEGCAHLAQWLQHVSVPF